VLMHDPALGGKEILRPQLLHMDQCALSRAKNIMLQGRKQNEFVIGVHNYSA